MGEINVIGLGYIGLPTALMLAANDVKVVGTDINNEIVDKLKDNQLTFNEKGLEELFIKAKENGIQFSNKFIKSNRYIVTVPTPYNKETKKIDVKFVFKAVESILEVCEIGSIIIIESTIAPGTIDKYIRPMIIEKGYLIGQDIHIVHAPERVMPGNMLHELINNSRTIGADNYEIGVEVRLLYERFCKGNIHITDIKTAEMSKVVENTYRDINIAFANELAKICRSEDINVYELIKITNMHPRVNVMQPGPGVGGHCISVDPWFLVGEHPNEVNLILSAREVNDSMPMYVLNRIESIIKEKSIRNISRIGIYGLTYKENINDVRESPTIQLLKHTKQKYGESFKVYDPLINNIIVDNQYNDFEEFIEDIDFIVIMVAHTHILNNSEKLDKKIVLDTRNCINFKEIYTI